MLDLHSIRSVTLDIAETYDSGQLQDQAAEVISWLLSQNYQIYLFSSNQKQTLTSEDFSYPDLEFVTLPLPPVAPGAQRYAPLVNPTNLWVTDDPEMTRWAAEMGLPLATRRAPPALGTKNVLRIGSLADLTVSLDPTAPVMREIERALRAGTRSGAAVIGLGGPPLSGYQELALRLKRHLEGAGFPLVELLDLSSLLRVAEAEPGSAGGNSAWRSEPIGEWVMDRLLGPAKAGGQVYVETLPEGIPEDFSPHLPLFLSEESVVLAFAGMPFVPPLADLFDVSVLLETAPQETTRRIYEMDAAEFEQRFIDQYLEHEGKAYQRYLDAHAVPARAQVRVDANTPGRFALAADS